jgi:hypothetical protein
MVGATLENSEKPNLWRFSWNPTRFVVRGTDALDGPKPARHGATMRRSRLRRFILKLSLLACGLLAGLILAELMLRWMVPKSRADLFRYTTDTERYKTMKPNNESIVYGVPLRTNELGFRDTAIGPIAPKKPGEYRVVVLGDSFTVGAGVPFEELATSRLETLLRAEAKGREVRVLNLGTAGYSLIEYALVLDEVALALQPDAVVIANYLPNDYETKTWLNNREIASGRRTVRQPNWFESLYLNQAFGSTVESLWGRATSPFRPTRAASAPARLAFGEGSEGWNENTDALLRIASRAREKGVVLRVCLLPHPSNFAKQVPRHEIVEKFCRDHGIAVTDVLPRFEQAHQSPRAFRINVIDSHPNTAYNEIVAKAMVDALAANGFPPAP